jgi:uncharacterized protein HemX
MAGLRAWLAQLDRRLGLRTYVIGAIAVLALAAGVLALVLTLQLRDEAATNGDVSSLRDQLSGVEQSATQAAQEGVRSLQRRVTDVETKIEHISATRSSDRRELHALQEEVRRLRKQARAEKSNTTPGNRTP